MADLSGLPNEILLLVFTCSPTIRSALRLSSVSQRFQSVWEQNKNHITRLVFEQQISDYEDAVLLATAEAKCSAPSLAHPSLRALAPYLVRNAEMGSRVTSRNVDWINSLPKENSRHTVVYTSQLASYYMIRRLVMACHRRSLRSALRLELEASSIAVLATHDEIATFMTYWMDYEESWRQQILIEREKEEHTTHDEMRFEKNKPEWNWMSEIMAKTLDAKIYKHKDWPPLEELWAERVPAY